MVQTNIINLSPKAIVLLDEKGNREYTYSSTLPHARAPRLVYVVRRLEGKGWQRHGRIDGIPVPVALPTAPKLENLRAIPEPEKDKFYLVGSDVGRAMIVIGAGRYDILFPDEDSAIRNHLGEVVAYRFLMQTS